MRNVFGQSGTPAGMLDQSLYTAFTHVQLVAENIDEVKSVSENITILLGASEALAAFGGTLTAVENYAASALNSKQSVDASLITINTKEANVTSLAEATLGYRNEVEEKAADVTDKAAQVEAGRTEVEASRAFVETAAGNVATDAARAEAAASALRPEAALLLTSEAISVNSAYVADKLLVSGNTFTKFFGKVVGGTGTVKGLVLVNGEAVYGPVTLTSEGFTDDVLIEAPFNTEIEFALGDEITGNPTAVFMKIEGSAA